jgi:hypothetical protein
MDFDQAERRRQQSQLLEYSDLEYTSRIGNMMVHTSQIRTFSGFTRLIVKSWVFMLKGSYKKMGNVYTELLMAFISEDSDMEAFWLALKTKPSVLPKGCWVELVRGNHRVDAVRLLQEEDPERWNGELLSMVILSRGESFSRMVRNDTDCEVDHIGRVDWTNHMVLSDNMRVFPPKPNTTLDIFLSLAQEAELCQRGASITLENFKTACETRVGECETVENVRKVISGWMMAATDPSMRSRICGLSSMPAFHEIERKVFGSRSLKTNPMVSC